MKKLMSYLSALLFFLAMEGMALANPAMLPKHPGYPMDAAKSPVTGQPLANDPGQTVPSVEEARTQAAAFHESQVINPEKEVRPNVVYEFENEKKGTKN